MGCKNLIFTLILMSLAANTFQREMIVTMMSSSDIKLVTTGNGNTESIIYDNMHTKEQEENDFQTYKVSAEIKENLNWYVNFKNSLIVDFASEDPKKFVPDNPNYYNVVSKRGFLLTSFSVFILLFLFVGFYLRIASGECGGYKTIIRKPTKGMRYGIFLRVAIGTLIFLVSFALTGYFSYKDRSYALNIASSLVNANESQLSRMEKIFKDIRRINKKKFNVIYSVLSYERFQVGMFIESIKLEYQKSLKNAKSINKEVIIGTKNKTFIKLLVILILMIVGLMSWIFVYKYRSLTNALLLSFLMGVLIVYMIHALGTSFSYFSIFTEICRQSVETFNEKKGNLRVRFYNSFQTILTCLPQKETELMTAQMSSLLIGENTLLIVLRNYFQTADKTIYDRCNGFEKAIEVSKNYEILKASIIQLTKVGEETDTMQRKNMLDILSTAVEIPDIYAMASELHTCAQLKEWNHEMNSKMCFDGLNAHFYSLIFFLISIFGVIIIGMAMFSSENIIRGLYNEEIQYVKTNKLRYDWN